MISRAWITINPVLVETVQCLLNIGTYWHMNPRSQNYPQETNEFDVEDNFKFVPYSLWHIPKMKLEKLIYCHHKHVFPKRFPALSLVSCKGRPRLVLLTASRLSGECEEVDAGWGSGCRMRWPGHAASWMVRAAVQGLKAGLVEAGGAGLTWWQSCSACNLRKRKTFQLKII